MVSETGMVCLARLWQRGAGGGDLEPIRGGSAWRRRRRSSDVETTRRRLVTEADGTRGGRIHHPVLVLFTWRDLARRVALRIRVCTSSFSKIMNANTPFDWFDLSLVVLLT